MTLIIFLYAYYIFLALWFVFVLVALYHLLTYGTKGPITFLAAMIFVIFSALILFLTFFYIKQTDWLMPLGIEIDYKIRFFE
jgi:hypothetical protein